MSEGVFVPGLFSSLGRTTAFEIENLQDQLNLPKTGAGSHDHDADESPSKAVAKKSSKSKVHSKAGAGDTQDNVQPQTPAGELAKAIQEKLRSKNKAEDAKASKQDPNASKGLPTEKSETLTAHFSGEGKEGNWASKFTASYDIGSINHRNEQRPDIAWYKIKHDSVLDRPPAWDFKARKKHMPLAKPEEDPSKSPHAFLTSTDINDPEAVAALTSRQRSMLRDAMGEGLQKPKQNGTAMGLNSERGMLGRVPSARIHIHAHEVSCAGDSDLLEQDIKGYPKLRYPRWDMDANSARGPLVPADSMGEPGKYDYSLDCIKGVPKSGIGFGKALPRSVCVSTMGYLAPGAGLHPEQKRTRGELPDRSRAKNSVRLRVTNVNDFDTELPRPPLPVTQGGTYHDTSDRAACESVHLRAMTYDADAADVYVTHRRDIAPKYDRMLGRGRDSVQGIRALSHDLAVRGSVGLGFITTKSMVEHSVDQREARGAVAGKENPNIGPKLDHTTYNVHNTVTERMLRGRPLVRGSGVDAKYGPLKQKQNRILANAYKRSGSLPGFESCSRFGGTRILAGSRSSSAIAGWAPDELEMLDA
jgi:hypothetical protein